MASRESRVRAQYERWLSRRTPVSLYVRWYLRYGGARYAEPLFEAMGPGPFARLLDVGCAAGVYLRWAAEHGHGTAVLAGVDITPALLAEAADRLESARATGASVVLCEASAVALPFAEASFDALICNGVIKYLDDTMLDDFLSEALRVLTPGGCIAIAEFGRTVPVQSALLSPAWLGLPTEHLRTGTQLCDELRRRGFSAVREVALKRLRRIPLTYEGAVATRP